MKDYLGFENDRNKKHAEIYTRLLKRAIKRDDVAVLIGHHITFEIGGDLETENEIPSADCLMFDHELMTSVFGADRALPIMRALVSVPCDHRDALLKYYLDTVEHFDEPVVDYYATPVQSRP